MGAMDKVGPNRSEGRNADRSGIALVIVLGLLALMVMLGVAFSIYMQTERLASGNYKNDVKARTLLHAGLALAVRDLRAQNAAVAAGSVPAYWRDLQSPTNAGSAIPSDLVQSLSRYVPSDALRGVVVGAGWVPCNAGASYVGRVAYVVLNCSGFLDVNHAGEAGVTRGVGLNETEIQLDGLPEVASANALFSLRDNHKRFESIEELAQLNTGGALDAPPANLVTFSAFPITTYPNGTNTPVVDVSGDDTALADATRHADIVEALERSGVEANEAEFVYTNLLDYVDVDSVPRMLQSACTERVPMFNEVQVRCGLYGAGAGPGNAVVGIEVGLEWAYPFMTRNPELFDVVYEVQVEGLLDAKVLGAVPDTVSGTADSTYVGSGAEQHGAAIVLGASPEFNCQTNVGKQLQYRLTFSKLAMVQRSVNKVVDLVTSNSMVIETVPFRIPALTGMDPEAITTNGVECIDPRFNWNGQPDGGHWVLYATVPCAGSMLAQNEITAKLFSDSVAMGYGLMDPDYNMHVGDAPLQTVGELSYLLRGSGESFFFRTLRLYDQAGDAPFLPLDTILDNLRLGTTNAVAHGLVTPNSRNTNALAAVFSGMPLDRYPGDATAVPLALDEAHELARFWQDPVLNPEIGQFRYPSDIGHATNVLAFLASAGLAPLQQEAFFRNTAGIFHPRQGYYLVLLFSQVTKDVWLPNGTLWTSVLSGQRAVVELWMDPLANESGGYPMLVRSFRAVAD